MKKFLKYFIPIFFISIIFVGIVVFKQKNNNEYISFEEYISKMGSVSEYVDDEIKESIRNLVKIKQQNSVSIGFITDLHINSQEDVLYLNNVKAYTAIANSGLLSLGVSGGDLYYGTWKNKEEGKVNLKYAKLLFDNVKIPVLYARGNHDCNIKKDPSEAISNEEYYNIMLKSLDVVFNEDDLFGGYYYKDIEEKKIRVCILNAFAGENYQYIFGSKQLDFIANNMLNFNSKSNPEEWQVLFFTHALEQSNAHPEFVEDREIFYNILTAYKNASNIELNGKLIDYSGQGKGTVIAVITGHHHLDLSSVKNDFLIITTRSASASYDREFSYDDVKESKDELAFDIFTINRNDRKIIATRVGRGEDREWSY